VTVRDWSGDAGTVMMWTFSPFVTPGAALPTKCLHPMEADLRVLKAISAFDPEPT
jgi:hypothetical protein